MVSVDTMDNISLTQDAYKAPFPLLSDPELTVHDAYRVSNEVDEKGIERLKSLGIDVERWSKRKHHKIAVPSIFLIDKQQVVRFAHAAKDHRTRPDLDPLLEALEKALKSDK